MDKHVRNLAGLSIAYGMFSAVASVSALVATGGLLGVWNTAERNGVPGIAALGAVCFHLLLAGPMIIGGVYLRRFREWARYFMVVCCAMNLLNPPLGTMLGGYGLWVLMTPETEPLFLEPAVRRATRTPPHR